MNPTKALPWLLAGLPVVAAIAYWAYSDRKLDAHSPPATVAKASIPEIKKKTQPATNASRVRKLTPEQQLAEDRYQEAKKRAEESKERATASLQRLAATMTPEYCAKMADSVLERRRAKFGTLLDSWNLDADKTREVTDILRTRELRRIQSRAEYFQDAYNPKNLKTRASQDQAEDQVARETLSLSLGESRGNELLNVMMQADADDLKLAEQMIQKRKGTR